MPRLNPEEKKQEEIRIANAALEAKLTARANANAAAMVKPLALLVAFGLMAGLLIAPSAQSQTAEKPVFVGPPPPEELKALAVFVGQWKAETTIKPSLRDKEGFTSRGEISCQWMHNGHFLRVEGFGLSKNGRFEHTAIISYIRATGKFRHLSFSTDGIVGEGIGEWDGKTNTLTVKGANLPEGWTAVMTMTLAKDRLIQAALVKNGKGEVVRDAQAVSERKK